MQHIEPFSSGHLSRQGQSKKQKILNFKRTLKARNRRRDQGMTDSRCTREALRNALRRGEQSRQPKEKGRAPDWGQVRDRWARTNDLSQQMAQRRECAESVEESGVGGWGGWLQWNLCASQWNRRPLNTSWPYFLCFSSSQMSPNENWWVFCFDFFFPHNATHSQGWADWPRRAAS